MNNLFATWHHRTEEVDVVAELDVVDLLSRAYVRLAQLPGLEKARRLVDIALDEVSALVDDEASYATTTR